MVRGLISISVLYYRKTNERKDRKLKETVFGFYLLKQALPKWIEEKMEEINKKS